MKKWAFTLTIPRGCKVHESDHVVRYRDLTEQDQKVFLLKTLMQDKVAVSDINYEKHKDGALHIHGTCQGTDLAVANMQATINVDLGYAANSNKIFYYKRYGNKGWDTYITKCQPKKEEPTSEYTPTDEDIDDFNNYVKSVNKSIFTRE